MSMNFKTCLFGGFDREDVIAFIEKAARESQERISALEKENNDLRSVGAQQEEESAQLRQQILQQEESSEQLRRQIQQQQEKLEELRQQTLQQEEALSDQCEVADRVTLLENEVEQLRSQVHEYQSIKDHIAEIEISAHQRNEEFRAQTIASLRKTMEAQLAWCEKAREQYTALNERFVQDLYQAQQALSTPDLSGFDQMERDLQELDESFDR